MIHTSFNSHPKLMKMVDNQAMLSYSGKMLQIDKPGDDISM